MFNLTMLTLPTGTRFDRIRGATYTNYAKQSQFRVDPQVAPPGATARLILYLEECSNDNDR